MLGKVAIIIEAAMAQFESDMGRAARIMEKDGRRMQREADQLGAKFKAAGKAAGLAIAAGLTVATTAAVQWTREIGKLGQEMDRLATLSGTDVETFQRLAAATSMVGVEQDKLASMMKDTQERVGEFMRSGGGEMAEFFEYIAPKVGVTADQFARLSGPEAMQLYINSLEKAGVSQSEMITYMEAMADDASLLIPLLRDNGRAAGELGDEASRLGGILRGETITASKDMTLELWRMDQVFKGVKIRVADAVMPALRDFIAIISDPSTMKAISDTAEAILKIATAATRAAAGIGNLIGSYRDWLADRGFTPADDDASMKQLEARKEKLEKLIENTEAGHGVWGKETVAQLRAEVAEIDSLIKAYPFRGVTATVDSTALGRIPKVTMPPLPQMPAAPRTATVPELSPADKARIEQEADWAAIQGVWDDAAIERHNREVDHWMEKSKVVEKTTNEMSVYADQAARNMQDAFAQFLFDPFEGGVKGMLKSFGDTLRKMAAQAAASEIFKAIGNWASSYTGKGAGFINSLGSAIKGQRAIGGPVNAGSMYEVAEGGRPELLRSHDGSTYLIPGSDGTVIPAGSSGGGGMAMANTGVTVQVINNSGAQARTERGTGPNGGDLIKVIIEQAVGKVNENILKQGGSTGQAMQQAFGLQRRAVPVSG